METITSRTNPLCTHLRKLASSVSYRRDCGEFLCDSPKLLEEALLWRAGLRTVVCTDPAALPALPDAVRRGRASVFAAHGALLLLPLIHLILLHIRIGSAISALIVHIQSLVYMLKVGCSYA